MSTELQPSKLGTKEHWDNVYEEELANFGDIGDEGEVWFGIESVEKMVEWTQANVPHLSHPSVLEVGSGNGTLLFALAEAGYAPTTLTGVDYSSDAVKLAKAISVKKGIEGITFMEADFLKDNALRTANAWDLILDKGTYDAIALGPKDENARSPATRYPPQLTKLLKPGAYFLITSCNFTEEELISDFATAETGLLYHSRIQHAVFTFGGRSGSACASVAFQMPKPN
ncbi:hypothetical protein AX15_001986 [Amanita polypyramis BW_CC]|nr:hypothetical protein AX15_001986 [Amanita polypyramis BW_CC]